MHELFLYCFCGVRTFFFLEIAQPLHSYPKNQIVHSLQRFIVPEDVHGKRGNKNFGESSGGNLSPMAKTFPFQTKLALPTNFCLEKALL